ncbi:hypothetical protein HMPREF1051_1000 [Neisseria sicca VK64]|uniref:Uncharacterized protein n=1 Tax=Neisseria sicca VK64 TaxID=1095748 RepID=I2NWJ2_NEISI|nr:hypothetical protein HMPREF1051_1000 [Neisseria sicca VK64]
MDFALVKTKRGFRRCAVFYSGLTLNQDKATKPQTVQIVRQGEVTPSWFKVNPLYHKRRHFQTTFMTHIKNVV